MAQIETRKEMAAAMANQKKAAEYIEGESDSEDSDEDELDVEIEHGGDDGEIEDIGLESRSSRSRNDEESPMDDDLPKRSTAKGVKKTARIAEADDLSE